MPHNFHRRLQPSADGWSISHLATLPAKSTSALCNRHSSTHHSNLPTEQLRWGTLTPNSAAKGEISHTYVDRPWHLPPLLGDELCDRPSARRQWPTQLAITPAQTQAHSSAFCPASQFSPPVFTRSAHLVPPQETRLGEQCSGGISWGPFPGTDVHRGGWKSGRHNGRKRERQCTRAWIRTEEKEEQWNRNQGKRRKFQKIKKEGGLQEEK